MPARCDFPLPWICIHSGYADASPEAPRRRPSKSTLKPPAANWSTAWWRTACVRNGNLLTGQKYVDLDIHPDAPAEKIWWTDEPWVFPTVSNGLDEIQDSVASIARKLDKVPFDQISYRLLSTMSSLEKTLKSTDQLMRHVDSSVAPQVEATLAEAQGAMKNAKDLMAQDSPLQSDLGATLLQLSRAAKSLAALADYLERHPESLLHGKPGDSP